MCLQAKDAVHLTLNPKEKAARKKLQVIVLGNSLLQRQRQPDLPTREVCCLLGAWIQHVVEGLSKFV